MFIGLSEDVSLMFIGLSEELSEFDVYWFEWGVDWVWCLLVCVKCSLSLSEELSECNVYWFVRIWVMSLMFISFSEVLSEFNVHWFVWDVDLVWCSLVCLRCWFSLMIMSLCLLIWLRIWVMSLMFISFSEVLSEFNVYWFMWGFE